MWRLVLCGAGFGMFASPNNRLMMNAVPRDRSGSAGGIIANRAHLGQTLGSRPGGPWCSDLFDSPAAALSTLPTSGDLAGGGLRRRGAG